MLERRVEAAKLSGGTSSDAIYAAVERVFAEHKLGGRILDYGSGVGNFVRRLLELQRFNQVSGMDIMPVPSDLAGRVEWVEQDLNAPVPGHDAQFDVIVAIEVIEHLENPRGMMRELFRMLRPGGTVIVTTPNNESWRSFIALWVRGHYVAFGDPCYPAHITALLRKDFSRIFAETGLRNVEFRFTNDGGIPGKPTTTWQRISLGLLRGLRYSDNLLCVGKKPA
jgi:2-polyprenyl-3-methyl-5-hydroxy-6-metoxy-1,4-benzoquinol methylase